MTKKTFIKMGTVVATLSFLFVLLCGNINISASTAYTGMRDITSLELVNEMRIGWNLGNTLDAIGGETNWGNPKTTKEMIDKVKEMGFNTVRFPVTWGGHVGPAPDYKIDEGWLNRVEEVVNYALSNDMYAIINLHHENSWLVPTYAQEKRSTEQLVKIWEQVATRFKDYGDYLIFETMNEPRVENSPYEWSGGTPENRHVINNFNLAAVNTIRSTGGNNAKRHIMIPAHAASAIDIALNDLVIPNNDDRIIISVHNYSPYFFAMDVNGTASWGSDSDKASLAAELEALYNRFIKNGRAVVIGEFGSINKNNLSDRIRHAEFFAKEARKRGITVIWWDNGYNEGGKAESYALLDRRNLTWYHPEIAEALVRGAGGVPEPTPTPTPEPTPSPGEDILYGDLNGDGIINSIDYNLLNRYILEVIDDLPVENYSKVADLNGDGVINSNDAVLLGRFILEIVDKFPVDK
ncbi:MAG TPA: cellulase family glycosylhydrolase [Acetivibrio saccincola]|nr:cellulase family glycosylhydrolase [Acetivibrio saccincola]HOA96724.1 cellulase family glycosylhydrolase [Acetivibrio saccincola]HQD28071.1 cellulase family glycosylhydrolase [Acetivibrio saccincola]